MTINYQYNSLTFLKSGQAYCEKSRLLPEDLPMADIFKTFVEGDGDYAVRNVDSRQLISFLHNNYINVKAAGGIVENCKGERLLMIRNDRADLPKGKVEAGETLSQAALRETQEETGLSDIQLGTLLLKTYHIYNLYGGWHFKQTSWFAMRLKNIQPLVPQCEEGITSLQWLPPKQWRQQLNDSYSTMQIITKQVADNMFFN